MLAGSQLSLQRAWGGIETDFGRAAVCRHRHSHGVFRQKHCTPVSLRTPAREKVGSCAKSLWRRPLPQQARPFRRNRHLLLAASAGNGASADDQPVRQKPNLSNLQRAIRLNPLHVLFSKRYLTPANLLQLGKASQHIVGQGWHLLKAHVWPILLIFAMCDGLTWVTARLSNRITNEVAIRLLSIDPSSLAPTLWFLSANPAFANWRCGYRIVMNIVIALTFPLSVLIRTLGTSAVILLCCRHPNTSVSDASAAGKPVQAKGTTKASLASEPTKETSSSDEPAIPTEQRRKGIRATVHNVVSTVRLLQPDVAAVWKKVFVTDLLVALQAVPLQALSLLILPLPFTLPRLLDLQATTPVVALDGLQGRKAIARSRELVKPLRTALGLPFLGLIFIMNITGPLKGQVLAALPIRWYWDLPELPIAAYAAFTILSLICHRLHNILPVVIYQQGQQHDAQPT